MPWSHCPNKNVFSDRLNWPYGSPCCLRSGGRLHPHSGSSSCEGPVSETAGRPVDSKRSSVSRTHLSDTNVGDELTVVDQVARSMAGQGLVDKRRDLDSTRRAATPEASAAGGEQTRYDQTA